MRLVLFLFFPIAAFAQDGCPPTRFTSATSAALLPSPSSHRVLVKQSDGSFTAFDLSNTSPYALLSTIPHFDRQLRPCNPASTGLNQFVEAIAPEPGGGYLVASPGGSFATNITAFDSGLHMTGQFQVPGAIQFADVNNDGKLDILAYTEPDYFNQIGVYLGSGEANFGTPFVVHLPSGIGVTDFTVGDLNGDGKLDIVGLMFGASPFVALGNGDGTFQAAQSVLPQISASNQGGLAVGDVNGDGKADLAVSEVAGNTNPTIFVALGNGDGTFATPVQFSAPTAGPVAIGDLNGDGKPDVVAGNFTILFGDGKGAFPTRRDYLAPSVGFPAYQQTIITDFNADGIPDIVSGVGTASVVAGDTAIVLQGTGGGKFAAPPASPIPGFQTNVNQIFNQTSAIASADFNGDHIADIAAISGMNDVSVLLGAGDGTFSQSFAATAIGQFGEALVVADFNRDGNLDFASIGNSNPSSSTVSVFLGKGDGTFQPAIETTTPAGASSLATGDFNGDGKPDLALLLANTEGPAEGGAIVILLGNGAGAFTTGASYAGGSGPVSLVTADFTGDGRLDLVVADAGAGPPDYTGGSLMLLTGNGDGTFEPQAPILFGSPARLPAGQLIAADFNRDGKPDIAFSLYGVPAFAVMLSSDGGTFAAPVVYADDGPIHAGDINGDGILDIVTDSGYRLGNGDGTFQPSVAGESGAALLADFNGDGKLDIASNQLAAVAVQLNKSQTAPPVAVLSAASFAPGPLQTGSIASAFGNFPSGAGVTVEDSAGNTLPATVLYASTTQVNFMFPSGLEAGPATVNFGSSIAAQVLLASNAAQAFTVDSAGLAAAYVTQVTSSGAIVTQPVFTVQNGVATPVPIDVTIGPTYLTLYYSGSPAELESVSYPIGSQLFQTAWAGPDPSVPGVEQVNVQFEPQAAGLGYVGIAGGQTPIYVVLK